MRPRDLLTLIIYILIACSIIGFLSAPVHAAITDIKFGQYQIADSQWNVSACTQTATCQIYSKNPGTAYKIPWTSGRLTWAAGDYVKFVLTGNTTNPYNAIQYGSNGVQKAVMGTGHIVNMGANYFFFVGSDNNTGQLFSGSSGMSNTSGVTWTGTLNPTLAQADAYSTSYSTEPLSAGQTAAPPSPVYSSSITSAQQTRKITNLGINPAGHNAIVDISGDDNLINIQQIGGNGHYVNVSVNGSVNSIDILQTTTGTDRHYMEASVVGGSNNLILKQQGSAKTQFVAVEGNGNTVSTDQKGTGNHYLDLKVTGNNHTAGIIQDGTGNHKATVELSGSQPWNFNLNQTGNTDKTYSLPYSQGGTPVSGACYTVGGCSLTVNQQ